MLSLQESSSEEPDPGWDSAQPQEQSQAEPSVLERDEVSRCRQPLPRPQCTGEVPSEFSQQAECRRSPDRTSKFCLLGTSSTLSFICDSVLRCPPSTPEHANVSVPMDMYMCYQCLSIFLADTYIISLVHLICLHPDQTRQTLL